MPSNKNPALIVLPGPGRLPAGVVPAGALLPPGGGGGGGTLAALEAHINKPYDAHFAHAIGIDPYYPPGVGPTPDPILSSVGGVVDGESVLDFIDQFKDLIPLRPNSIGFTVAAAGTSAQPYWNLLEKSSLSTGGYKQGTNVQFTHFVVDNAVTFSGGFDGLLFPADRGVLAFYKNTSGNFLDSANTTLAAAISLNDSAPVGIPNSAFNESLRHGQQPNYTPSGVGLDQFGLAFRLPYLTDYTAYPGTPFGPYSANFYRYQLAVWTLLGQSISVGDSQNLLIVHWRETFATSLAAIGPTSLTLGNLVSANCYSAVPTSNTSYGAGSWDDDTAAVFNVNRHFVFRDAASASAPVGTVFTTAPVGSPTTTPLSGVQFYSVASGAGRLRFNLDLQATGLFADSFQTGSVANVDIPSQFNSSFDPLSIDFTLFGGSSLLVPFYQLNKFGGGLYSPTNSPAPGDTGEYQNASLSIPTPVPYCPLGGIVLLSATLRTLWQQTGAFYDANQYLFNSLAAGGSSTSTFEPFTDEVYRYSIGFDPTSSATVPIIPTGGNIFPSASVLVTPGQSLQVASHLLIYPANDYSTGYFPTGQPDYSNFTVTDGADHLRRYQRAVDTGVARNTGWIRLLSTNPGLLAAFTAVGAYNGIETTGHLGGGAIIQIKVPGASGSDWLDIGRQYGDPGLIGTVGTSPFYGCQTGVVTNFNDIYVSYNTGSNFTSNNGSGQFLLFVRITFINAPSSGLSVNVEEFQWYPPTFTPP